MAEQRVVARDSAEGHVKLPGPVCQYSMKNTNEMGFFKLGMMPLKAMELLWFIEEEHLNWKILLLYFSG